MVYLCGRPLPNRGRCTLGRETAIQPMVWGDDGWLRTSTATAFRRSTLQRLAACRRIRSRRRRRATTSTARTLPIDFQWLRTPYPEELFSLTARPGHLRLLRPRDDRQPVPPVARRAAPAVALLQRVARSLEFEPRALPADGRSGLLLQRRQVPLPVRLARRAARQAPARDVGAARPGAGRRLHRARSRFRRTSPWNCASRSTTSGCTSRYRVQRRATGAGCRSSSTPASCPTRRRAPGLPNFTGAFVGMACQDMSGARARGFRLVRVRRAVIPR